ncbi:hypothetical protein [Vibrio bivalvicida]|uniref:Secreted protein n=1 Tax=Vibrio bivalvicida TaxID=1276888 RepID=A0ABV4MM98_9VIBR
MKYFLLIIMLPLVIASMVQAADNSNKGNYKIGASSEDEPCTCVFNNTRMWNPEKILWNGEEWYCSKYNDDGTCDSVALLNSTDSIQNPCLKQTTPIYCVFNLTNAPKSIQTEDGTWTCSEYNDDQKCTKAKKTTSN